MSPGHGQNSPARDAARGIYRVLSALLSYPEQALIDALPEIEAALLPQPLFHRELGCLLDHLGTHSLIELQETYVEQFDRSRSQSLYLFEHIHGESRERGEALLDLLQEYQRHGFEPNDMNGGLRELPDYLPLFLEFLGQLPAEDAGRLLGDAIDVIDLIGGRLHKHASPYAAAFRVLAALSPVKPQPIEDAPAREMDALLETVGPGDDGSEPLLKPDNGLVKPIHFYR
ncbi:MAG: nitrate reductase molybdenum cofactor assembly chaperone [Lautropia sp.]|nr:nitrate reductase molybdenum cofactor assembly chaperone [Lautropia sp.]